MPVKFSSSEKDLINRKLIEAAEEEFSHYGIRRARVEDLCKKAGIAKGSFYIFYESKEALAFEVLKNIETRTQTELLAMTREENLRPVDFLKNFFHIKEQLMERYPFLLRLMEPEEYEYLTRKATDSQTREMIERDTDFSSRLTAFWQDRGWLSGQDPEVFSAAVKILFLADLHKKVIGDRYQTAVDLLITGLGMTMGETNHDNRK